MQTARIPTAILLALGMASAAACKWTAPPCLNAPPAEYYDGEDSPDRKLDLGDDPDVGPCLSPVEPDEPPVTPCLEVAIPDEPPLGPCLKVVMPPAAPEEDNDKPRVGPCLRVAPPRDSDRGPKPLPPKSQEAEGMTARADVLEKLADSLPADVLAKLRKREG